MCSAMFTTQPVRPRKGLPFLARPQVTFWGDVTNGVSAGDGTLFKVSSGSSVTFFGTYGGTGISGAGNVYYEADISPGFSPASVNYGGSVFLDTTSHLIMQLGGTTVGSQYDKINVAGQLSLGGALDVVLINGFTPAVGNSFNLLDWSTLSGHFSSLSFAGTVLGFGLGHDRFIYDRHAIGHRCPTSARRHQSGWPVTVADIQALMTALSDMDAYIGANPDLKSDPQLQLQVADVNGDGKIDNADVQALIALVANDTASGSSLLTPVPEPATLTLSVIGLSVLATLLVRQGRGLMKDHGS